MTRQLIGKLVAKKALELGATVSWKVPPDGAMTNTGCIMSLRCSPRKLEILAPVRDFDLTRQEELMLCEHWGVPVEEFIVGGDDKPCGAGRLLPEQLT